MTVVFTNGCFDILHRGHMELLRYCKSLGTVTVGINSDASVERLKGPFRPYFNQDDRKFMLESCKYVDEVLLFEEDTPYALIEKLRPDIIVKGVTTCLRMWWAQIYVPYTFLNIWMDILRRAS